MKNMLRTQFCVGVGLAALLAAMPVAAQTSDAQGVPQSADEALPGDIIVTATRREESIRDVPSSITAFTPELMDRQGVRSIGDIARLAPGITFNKTGSLGTSISIRGISSGAGAATVGVYIDDTPINQRATIASGNFSSNAYPQIFDLERVEVLRGPQGTLFGASSQGGTIRFITPTPDLQNNSVYARGELATTEGGANSYEGGIAVGGPIIQDKLGFRGSIWYRNDGGFVDHYDAFTGRLDRANANEQSALAFRFAIKAQLSESLSVTPSFFYQKTRLDDTNAVWMSLSDPRFSFNGTDVKQNRFGHAQPLQQPYSQNFMLPALKVEYEGAGFDVISNTSYFRRRESGINDFTAFEVPLWTTIFTGATTVLPNNPGDVATGTDEQKNSFFTQEVRIQSNNPDARLNWTLGGFYSKNKVQTNRSVENTFLGGLLSDALGFCTPATCIQAIFGVPLADGRYLFVGNTATTDEQIAGFGQIELKITDKLKLTAGARIAKTKFSFENYADGPVNGPPAPRTDTGSSSETPVTPKVGLSYQADNGNLYYATIADGVRIGGANVPVNNAGCQAGLAALGLTKVPETYKSDRTRSYEAGAKLNLAGNALTFDGSVFLIKWKNRIGNVAVPNGCPLSFTDNLGDVTSYGFDLAVNVRPVDGLTLTALVGDANATYDDDYFPTLTQTKPTVSEGDAISGSRTTFTLSADYRFNLTDATEAYLRGDFSHIGKNDRTPELNVANASYDVEARATPALNLVNLRAGVELKGWDVSAFVNNVFNENNITTNGALGLGSPIVGGFIATRPRTFGITAAYRY